ncbi:hypothetical protein QTG54_017072 [Skeletonema marinoi]|uniref:Glycoside hydrolase family 19 catalytic domain-containing protein n=1 Tax=Skeletonema marinoi TaxID=267567 RepID=A0AAD8XRL9_9STRA|nr:hypothetical protein QTG54_017072 [Skeletonema marinoi]
MKLPVLLLSAIMLEIQTQSVNGSQMLLTNLVTALEQVKGGIDTKLFLYQNPLSQWEESTVYRFNDFLESLKVMSTSAVAGKKFYIGEDVTNGHVYGLVNIATFLAQSMKETIKYDACDENSWDLVGGKYPLSNACGQLGQSYQDYQCSEEEKHMECPVDPNMSITAVTHAKWYGAPAPLYCGPKTDEQPHSGFWDHSYSCNKSWANPPETCDVYEGQKAGIFDQSRPYASTAGRTDVEGCCWWGRGVIQTSGICNFGKLNYYLGARAAEEGRDSKYPSVDFCKDPEIICSSSEYKELKWVAGMFYWMESVQPYNIGGWKYMDELQKFVEGGMQGTSFIDAVSGIVNRGCHNPPCGTGAVDGGYERSQNFKKVLETFFDAILPEISPLGTSLGLSPLFTSFNPDALPPSLSSSPSSVDVPQPVLEHVDSADADPTQDPVSSSDTQINHINDVPTHYCNEHTNLPSDSKAVDVVYQYEVVLSHSINLQDVLLDVKKEVMANLADSLGCTTESKGRSLRDTVHNNTFIGIQEGIDKVDTGKESCSMASFSGCIPIVSHLTGYFGNSASGENIQKAEDQILYIIQQGMLEGRYNSDQIRWIVFTPTDDAKSSSLESVYIIPHDNSSGSIWVPFASLLICSLVIVIAIVAVLIFKEKAKDQVVTDSLSGIVKLQSTEEHYAEESSDDSFDSDEPLSCPDDVVEMQEPQDLNISLSRRKYLQCNEDVMVPR